MKTVYSIILIIILISIPSVCMPAYVIQLKNGSRFITYRYWNEGNQIKFYLYGGIMGVDKTKVEKITESDLLSPDSEVIEKKESEKNVEPEPNNKERKEEKKPTEKIDVDYYKNKKKQLMKKYRRAKKRLNKAIVRRDKQAKKKAQTAIKELTDKMTELSNELKSKNDGVLPGWWYQGKF